MLFAIPVRAVRGRDTTRVPERILRDRTTKRWGNKHETTPRSRVRLARGHRPGRPGVRQGWDDPQGRAERLQYLQLLAVGRQWRAHRCGRGAEPVEGGRRHVLPLRRPRQRQREVPNPTPAGTDAPGMGRGRPDRVAAALARRGLQRSAAACRQALVVGGRVERSGHEPCHLGRRRGGEPGYSTAPGYGNNWNDWLDYRVAVANTALASTVRWSMLYNHDTEPGYDFLVAAWDSAGSILQSGGDHGGQPGHLGGVQRSRRVGSDGRLSAELLRGTLGQPDPPAADAAVGRGLVRRGRPVADRRRRPGRRHPGDPQRHRAVAGHLRGGQHRWVEPGARRLRRRLLEGVRPSPGHRSVPRQRRRRR